jgi:hypothetical protein
MVRYNKASRRSATNTAPALTITHPVREGRIMAESQPKLRDYVSQLNGRQLGAFKTAAAKVGLTIDQYIDRYDSGQKRCTKCKAWKSHADFHVDLSRWDKLCSLCIACQTRLGIDRYVPVADDERRPAGPPRKPIVPDNKKQARHFINLDVARGLRPNPNELFCVFCGHKGSDRRHEYHHHLGYSAEHFFDVLPCCTICHSNQHSRG